MTGYVLEVGVDSEVGRVCVGEVGPFSSPTVALAWFDMHRGKTVEDLFSLPLTFEWSEADSRLSSPVVGWTLIHDDGDTTTLVSESTV